MSKKEEIKSAVSEEVGSAKTVEETPTMVEDFEAKYKRALADYQNLLKQTAREKEEFGLWANENLLREFITVYDYLKLSLEHSPSDDKWLEGVKHVLAQFKKILTEAGVQEIDPQKQAFDHATMEALEEELTAVADQDGQVAKVVKGGYSLNKKVIIPAKVIVYKFKNN